MGQEQHMHQDHTSINLITNVVATIQCHDFAKKNNVYK